MTVSYRADSGTENVTVIADVLVPGIMLFSVGFAALSENHQSIGLLLTAARQTSLS